MADIDNNVDLHNYPATRSAEPTGPLDAEALREKYRQERDKRLRDKGTDQYNFAEGDLARYDDDPYVGPPVEREPQHQELDVLIIGGGFGGLQAGVAMRKAKRRDNPHPRRGRGLRRHLVLEPLPRCALRRGGLHLPALPGRDRIHADGAPRSCGTAHQIGQHFDLYKDALFQTRVTGMDWDEDSSRWIVTTDRGDRLATRFVVTQSGIFSRPQLPGIPGIETFKGKSFHTSRWDYDYTGGDSKGELDRLHDKRVGLIGTGATSLQAVPHLAASAHHLTVFQRTPTAVGPRDNAPTDVEWFKSLPAGWHQKRIDSFNLLRSGAYVDDCPVHDGWTRFFEQRQAAVAAIPEDERSPEVIAAESEKADFAWNEMIRARVDATVQAKQKAEGLKAYYKTLCKRPWFSDDYLPAFNQDNVALVDTAATGIERITEIGVVVDGVEHELDCLIFATGFELGTTWSHQAGYEVVGRDGVKLSEKWENGIRTFHGPFSSGFPNIFFMGRPAEGHGFPVSVGGPVLLA
jgi:cation diffusion facilitator CzcD-associated flavoprotein CzcO